MKHCCLLFICLLTALHIQAQQLIWPAKKVEQAYEIVLKNPRAIISQMQYLEAFPKDKDTFIAVFNPDDNKQLYSVSTEHIALLQTIAGILPDSVLRIGLGICKTAKWSSGPVDKLQHMMLSVAAANPESFVNEIYLLKRKEREAAAAFLAEVESNPPCPEYKALTDTLQKIGAHNIAGLLTRSKVNTH